MRTVNADTFKIIIERNGEKGEVDALVSFVAGMAIENIREGKLCYLDEFQFQVRIGEQVYDLVTDENFKAKVQAEIDWYYCWVNGQDKSLN